VRRTEEVGVDYLVGLLYIIIIGNNIVAQRTYMVIGMVAHLMALIEYAAIEVGMAHHVFAHHEEGGLGTILLEGIEDERCGLRYGPIVEGEIYRVLLWIDAPECLGVYPP
jgi:hypothetical protein